LPVMVRRALWPMGAVLLAVSVIVLNPVVGFGLKDAVTPLGQAGYGKGHAAGEIHIPEIPQHSRSGSALPMSALPTLERVKVGA